ncbi:hypothetical protein VTK73DRAFT_7005 [Phialemonium thermophilum]|uniref:ACT domain-containing protein n=1 Tax=Phialemonium thermophilum TaxID=223376 RepID=A0ABR3WGX2_9PEZI
MMRRARRKQSDAALREAQSRERLNAAAQQNQRQQEPQQPRAGQHRDDVRWDGMTGEPTGSPAGIPPQVRPADYAQGLGIRASPSPPQQQRSPTSGITSFGDRVRQMVQTGKGERKAEEATSYRSDPAAGAFTSSRPGWRGASGRTALVEPVRDNLQVAPLKIPEKSLRIPEKSSKRLFSPTTAKAPRTESPSQSASPNEQLSPPGPPPGPAAGSRETVRRVVPSSQIAPPVGSSEDTPEADASGSQRKQLSPSSDRFVGVDASATAPRVSAPQETQINRGPDHQRMPIRRKPAPSAEPANEGGHPEQSSELPNDAWVQPPSRFSITTYATSTAETPRASLDDLPPMPTPPQQYLSGSSPANLRTQGSVMDRKRPKIGGGAYDGDDKVYSTSSGEPIVISLKDEFTMSSPFSTGDRKTARPPAQQQQQQQQRQPNLVTSPTHSGGRPSSTASGQLAEKSLPPAPPETTADRARDRVGLLNARLTALGNRRINLTRSIQQMTELMPRDHVLDSAEVIRKREAERRKVEALRSELADVRREEYEIGLQLHRVYKRLDREAQWDSTSLWVRRVTE